MKFYSFVKAAALFAAVCGLAMVCVASDAYAQQGNEPYGQTKKTDPSNGNNSGTPPGLDGKNKERGNCNGRGCSDPAEEVPTDTVTNIGDVDDGDVLIIDCLLPQYKDDPLCYLPAKKPAKRKVVSVKLEQETLAVTPPVVTPVAAPVPAPVAPPAAPAPFGRPTLAPSGTESNDIGVTNFQ